MCISIMIVEIYGDLRVFKNVNNTNRKKEKKEEESA